MPKLVEIADLESRVLFDVHYITKNEKPAKRVNT